MKPLKKILALILVINIILGTIPDLWNNAFAAPSIHLSITGFQAGTLNIAWDLLQQRGDTVITYHSVDSVNPQRLETIVIPSGDPTPNQEAIAGLKNDYVYDIKVQIKDKSNSSVIGEDTIYFLPGISFYSEAVDQQPEEITGGGSETGVMPALKLSWAIPRVYDGTDFVYINDAPETINSGLKQTNFSINISDRLQRSDVVVSYDISAHTYSAKVAGDDTRTADVKHDSANGMLYFYLLGRKDDAAYLPTISEVLNNRYTGSSDPSQNNMEVVPDSISGEKAYVLPHRDILPGTVYVMNISAFPVDSSNAYMDALSYGSNGSPLLGTFPYVSTPIRFALTKDSTDYIYVKIYKVNKGTLDLPRLYYEIQTNSIPSNQDGTWNVKKTLDDTYFSGEFAYTVINGINPNNTLYYRIVVKTDGSRDKVESPVMPYVLKDDTSRPPVPKGVIIVKKEPATNPGYTEKSTDVTIAWDKPANWDQVKNNIYFHFLLNIAPVDLNIKPDPILEAEGKQYGSYPAKYRLVKYVSAESPDIDDSGTKLQYTLKGFDLFKWEDDSGNLHDIPNDENYPAFLLPNKVYYLQMYTTSDMDRGSSDPSEMSDKSLTTSFTTLSGNERDVPLPNNFKLSKNSITDQGENYIEVQFDKVNINWANYTSNHSSGDTVYYDLYMSSRPDSGSFVRIGSTEYADRDIAFEGADDLQSMFIKARVSVFRQSVNAYDPDRDPATDNSIDPYDVFGEKLLSNTTYYFIVKTRLSIKNPPNPPNPVITKESQATAVLPVTTVRGNIGSPDESGKRPVAPTDFTVARDANGNLLLTGQTVAFSWLKQESGVTYRLICTSERVAPDADPDEYNADPVYLSFNQAFTGSRNNEILLNPMSDPLADNFSYDGVSKTYRYDINTWLFPNRLYYFSLRAEVMSGDGIKASSWISIPVTTTLIEGPTMLEAVNDSQLAFNWTDNNPNMKAEDYRIYLKGPGESSYKLLARSQASVVRDVINGNILFYGRIYNLKSNTQYSVRVEKPVITNGTTTYSRVYDNTNLYTMDDYHQLEVKWKGLPADEYSYYEIAVKTAEDQDYTVLTSSDLEFYTDAASGHTYPYYIEKTPQTAGTNYSILHARIKSVLVTLADGTMGHRPLRSNTRYYIKVRAVKVDPADSTLITYSKYIGPIDTRTEFNQDDYNDSEQDEDKKAAFLDKIAKLEEGFFWRMGMSSSSVNKLLIKGDRVVNAIKNSTGYSFVMDISGIEPGAGIDAVYIPVKVFDALNAKNKNFIIKTAGAEFTLRPKTIDPVKNDKIAAVKKRSGVQDMFMKFTVSRSELQTSGIPAGVKPVSKVNRLELQAVGSSKTDTKLKDMFHDKLYNNETGLIKTKMNILMDPYDSSGPLTQQELDRYIGYLVGDVESELSEYIEDTVEGGWSMSGVIVARNDINTLAAPAQVKLSYTPSQGQKLPYAYYDGKSAWQKITNNIINSGSTVAFNISGTGKFAIFAPATSAGSVPDGYWAKESINSFTSKYDLNDIFPGANKSFNPELKVSAKELILLYEKVLNKTDANNGLDIKQKAKKLGLDTVVSTANTLRSASRQETAAVLVKLYCVKLGVKADSLKAKKNLFIKDDDDIDDKYYRYVQLSLDLGALKLDRSSNFIPRGSVTRAQMIDAFVKVLKLTGDIK